MRSWGPAGLLLFCLTTGAAAQTTQPPYADEMRKGDAAMQRRLYDEALQSYKKAYALSSKTSLDAVFAMAMAYRGLRAYKNVIDLVKGDALKLAVTPEDKAKALNIRGAALASLSEKPTDKKLDEAIADFRAALEA